MDFAEVHHDSDKHEAKKTTGVLRQGKMKGTSIDVLLLFFIAKKSNKKV
ncbi:MAG: hypothetical protein ACTH5N_06365 [Psychroflexus halocasei]